MEDHRRQRHGVQWPTGSAARANRGSRHLRETDPELDWVRRIRLCVADKLAYGLVQNRAAFIKPEVDSFQSAAAGADRSNAKDFNLVMTDAPGEKLSHHGDCLRDHVQKGQAPGTREEATDVSAGPCTTARGWPKKSTTCPCPPPSFNKSTAIGTRNSTEGERPQGRAKRVTKTSCHLLEPA